MTQTWVRCFAGATVVALAMVAPTMADAQSAVMTTSDGRTVSIGGGLRTSFRTTEVFPESGDYDQNFLLDSVRLYVTADIVKDFSVQFNTEYGGATSELRVLDALVKYAPNEKFNVWMGRHLPPSDRANLAGPYYANAFDYPGLVSRYPAIFAGRDNGVMVNGQVQGGKFKYAGGIYEGAENVTGVDDTLLYATRLVYNVLDPEPGYYNNGTYYGSSSLLAIGFAAQTQSDVVDTVDGPEGFTGFNVDVLFEKKLASEGVLTLEGAAYKYEADGEGSAYLITAAYLLPKMMGIGQLQPHFRFQEFEDESVLDFGAHYVIKGHNARISAVVTRAGFDDFKTTAFTLGSQFQF